MSTTLETLQIELAKVAGKVDRIAADSGLLTADVKTLGGKFAEVDALRHTLGNVPGELKEHRDRIQALKDWSVRAAAAALAVTLIVSWLGYYSINDIRVTVRDLAKKFMGEEFEKELSAKIARITSADTEAQCRIEKIRDSTDEARRLVDELRKQDNLLKVEIYPLALCALPAGTPQSKFGVLPIPDGGSARGYYMPMFDGTKYDPPGFNTKNVESHFSKYSMAVVDADGKALSFKGKHIVHAAITPSARHHDWTRVWSATARVDEQTGEMKVGIIAPFGPTAVSPDPAVNVYGNLMVWYYERNAPVDGAAPVHGAE